MHAGAALPNNSTTFNILLSAKEHTGQLGCVSIMIYSASTAQYVVYHNFESRAAICGCFSNISERPAPRRHALRSVVNTLGYARSYIG